MTDDTPEITPELKAALNGGDFIGGGDFPSTKGPAEFADAAPAEEAWIGTENPTDDPEVFARLARQMSVGLG